MRHSSAQATEPSYELHTLGWKAFQQLCVSIAGEVWGQVVQGFHDTRDSGRDGAFYGTWRPAVGEPFEGSFTVQCKFSAQASKVLALPNVKDELAKAKRLAALGLADNYFLFTNAPLTGASDETIRAAFESIPGIKRFVAYGRERISQFIRESPRLRMLVPRIYGLGDLSQILDQRAYGQAQEILSSLGDDLAKFVITNAYQSSAKALVEHGFILLLGEPACGKSAIAAALALGALDEWGCSTLKLRDANDFVTHWNIHEPKQFFWVDDAFGATQLDWQGTLDWNRVFPHIRAAIRRGAKFVFTSRDYIYRNARSLLKESALPSLNESQIVIRVEQLTKDERELILYNHIRLGTQPTTFKQRIKPLLPAVAAHLRFSPEIARRLGHPAFTKELRLTASGVSQFVEQPIELLQEIIRTLDAGCRSAIALVFMRGGMLQSPITVTSEEEQALGLLGASSADVRNSLNALEGSLLIQVQQDGNFWWRFKHPTIFDAFGGIVAENRELMDIYLLGTPVSRLMIEIACGDVTLKGVKVKVPSDRYEGLISRIEAFSGEKRQNSDSVNRFLAFRADRNFVASFLNRNPDLVPSLQVGSYFYLVSDVSVINRLHEFGLLLESERLRHVAAVRDLAVCIPDAGFLDKDIITFLTQAETVEVLEHVCTSLLPNLDDEIDNWRGNLERGQDPEEHFSDLRRALKKYERALSGNPQAVSWIEAALTSIDAAIEELRSEEPEEPEGEYYSATQSRQAELGESRSIFDDIDQ